MTRRERIDMMREARLWIGQIVVPSVTLMTTMMTIPDVRNAVSGKVQEMRQAAVEKKASKERSKIRFVG